MKLKPALPLKLDVSQIDQLACPACFGRLQLHRERLRCADCRRAYPILEGIPILIAERAEITLSPDEPI
jgi:uncharacterized protein